LFFVVFLLFVVVRQSGNYLNLVLFAQPEERNEEEEKYE